MTGYKNEHKHLYDRRWRRARLAYLTEHPLCVYCKLRGTIRASDTVHHHPAHEGDPEQFWKMESWNAICFDCHQSDGARQDAGKPIRGCDLSGNPIDPAHHWRTEGIGPSDADKPTPAHVLADAVGYLSHPVKAP